jgi:hypothetical protein
MKNEEEASKLLFLILRHVDESPLSLVPLKFGSAPTKKTKSNETFNHSDCNDASQPASASFASFSDSNFRASRLVTLGGLLRRRLLLPKSLRFLELILNIKDNDIALV